MKEPRALKKLYRLIEHRAIHDARVQAINAAYEPRLQKLIATRDTRTSTSRRLVYNDTLGIKTIILGLNGGEMGAVRKKYPKLKELPPAIRSNTS